MAELRNILLSEIDEPPIAIRLTMNDEQLDDLAQSIAAIGLQNPITVIQNDGRYRIVTGHRRYIAHQKINRHDILCLVRQPGEIQEIASMVHENILREDVNPAEESIFYSRLVQECGYTEADLIALTHRSPEYIGDRFRLLRGDEVIFAAVQRGDITFSTARELNKCDDFEMRRFYLDNAIRGGHASRVVKRWVDDWRQNQAQKQAALVQPVGAAAPAEPEPEKFCCALCGGYRDPWNFVNVTIHKMEWDAIQRSLREGAHADTAG
jgi:ParB family chromosome partitioning protein